MHGARFWEGCPANQAGFSATGRSSLDRPRLEKAKAPADLWWPFLCLILLMLNHWSNAPLNHHGNFVASYIDQLIGFVSAHAWLAYLTLFLAALLEAVPVVGSVIPGSTTILALSALVPGGELKLQWVLAAAIAGALIGDGSAFEVGYSSKHEILSTWPLSRYPGVIAQSEAFFRRWGIWAVFFARFVPPIRAFVPITAGALGMAPVQFFATNIPAVLLWATAHVLPGVVAISALHRYAGVPHHAGLKPYWIVAVMGGAIIAAVVTWAIRRRNSGGVQPAAERVRGPG